MVFIKPTSVCMRITYLSLLIITTATQRQQWARIKAKRSLQFHLTANVHHCPLRSLQQIRVTSQKPSTIPKRQGHKRQRPRQSCPGGRGEATGGPERRPTQSLHHHKKTTGSTHAAATRSMASRQKTKLITSSSGPARTPKATLSSTHGCRRRRCR